MYEMRIKQNEITHSLGSSTFNYFFQTTYKLKGQQIFHRKNTQKI